MFLLKKTIKNKTRLFLIGIGLGWLVSLIYLLILLLCAHPTSDSLRWFLHNATFSLHHFTAMSFAMGLFFAAISCPLEGIPLHWRQCYAWGIIGMLIVLFSGAFFTVLKDSKEPGIKPISIVSQSERKRAYVLELQMRNKTYSDSTRLSDEDLSQKKEEYKELVGLKENVVTRRQGNNVAKASIGVDLFFSSFIALYAWFVLVVIFRRSVGVDKNPRRELVVIYLLIGFWFPLRFYGAWYSVHFLDCPELLKKGSSAEFVGESSLISALHCPGAC